MRPRTLCTPRTAVALLTGALLGVAPLSAAVADEDPPVPVVGGLLDPADDEPVPAEPEPADEVPKDVPDVPQPGEGEPVLGVGDTGRAVEKLQVRLLRAGVRDEPVTGLFGKETVAAVKKFQKSVGYENSGTVDQATLDALEERTGDVDREDILAGKNRPIGKRLPVSCLTGDVVCVDKTLRTVRWVKNGKVKFKLDARFGSDELPTREGIFRVTRKSRDHVSSLYDTAMPFALFFDRGQAVHYSPDFASRGYYGQSHGCVNTRDYATMRKLFNKADLGDRVVVYRSKRVEQSDKKSD